MDNHTNVYEIIRIIAYIPTS